jgi:DNA-binding phage protein
VINTSDASPDLARLREDRAFMLAYLRASMRALDEPGGYESFIAALRQVVDAHGGAAELMKAGGSTRAAIERALSADGQPRLKAVQSLLTTLGLKLVISE